MRIETKMAKLKIKQQKNKFYVCNKQEHIVVNF